MTTKDISDRLACIMQSRTLEKAIDMIEDLHYELFDSEGVGHLPVEEYREKGHCDTCGFDGTCWKEK